jgi:hypothetical protein
LYVIGKGGVEVKSRRHQKEESKDNENGRRCQEVQEDMSEKIVDDGMKSGGRKRRERGPYLKI